MASRCGRNATASTVVARRGQVDGFASQCEALHALQVELERLRRRNGRLGQTTLSELVAEYLAQHEAARRTIAKLRWLLAKSERRVRRRVRRPAGRRSLLG
jgi:hypothetical protein